MLRFILSIKTSALRLFLLSLFVLSIVLPLQAMASDVFNKTKIFFSQLDSLAFPHPTINTIEQDNLGFMWFGTQGGIVKFDGINSTVYQFAKFEQTYGVNDWIHEIYSDSEGRIWVASGKSISLYIPETDSFDHFNLDEIFGHELILQKTKKNRFGF